VCEEGAVKPPRRPMHAGKNGSKKSTRWLVGVPEEGGPSQTGIAKIEIKLEEQPADFFYGKNKVGRRV